MSKLNVKNVRSTFKHCLFDDIEPTDNHISGEGVRLKAGFHPERLKESEPVIAEMLDELSDHFKATGGKGWSFLNMCEDKNGNQWTGLHTIVDELLTLGIATKQLSYCLPREQWNILPGGVPYIVYNNQ